MQVDQDLTMTTAKATKRRSRALQRWKNLSNLILKLPLPRNRDRTLLLLAGRSQKVPPMLPRSDHRQHTAWARLGEREMVSIWCCMVMTFIHRQKFCPPFVICTVREDLEMLGRRHLHPDILKQLFPRLFVSSDQRGISLSGV